MPGQAYDWTCSVCSTTWVLQSIGLIGRDYDAYSARYDVGAQMGYPNCVNEVYGCMSSQCVIDQFARYGLQAKQAWVNFDQAFAICSNTTGVLNGQSWYHFVGIRGTNGSNLWVANSAPGYRGVWDTLDRGTFNSLGPFQIIYLVP